MPIDLTTAAAMTASETASRRTVADDALIDLHIRTLDAKAGFETMVAKAEPAFRPVAQRFFDLHSGHAVALAPMLAVRGLEDASGPSLMASVNKAVVSVRALFDEIDADIMDRVRKGEAHVRAAFDEAIASGVTADELQILLDLRAALDRLLSETQDLG